MAVASLFSSFAVATGAAATTAFARFDLASGHPGTRLLDALSGRPGPPKGLNLWLNICNGDDGDKDSGYGKSDSLDRLGGDGV